MAQEQTASTGGVPANGPAAADLEASIRRMVKSAVRKALPAAIKSATERLGHDAEVAGLVRLLASRSNDAREEVIRKALTFYGLALDAREKGNKVVIVGPDDEIIHDVVGFEAITG